MLELQDQLSLVNNLNRLYRIIGCASHYELYQDTLDNSLNIFEFSVAIDMKLEPKTIQQAVYDIWETYSQFTFDIGLPHRDRQVLVDMKEFVERICDVYDLII